jgi:hypothetical protein
MVSKDEALKIENSDFNNCTKQELFEYIVVLREALEQPAKEPVALIKHENGNYSPKHQWQGLTDDEIENARYNWERHNDYKHNREIQLLLADFARAVEAKLKEKNYV